MTLTIELQRDPPLVIVCGLRIETAPPIGELLRILGPPSRVEEGPKPAPTGFRNNQQHVFDPIGLHINEHHHTRRAQAIGIWLSVAEPRYRFTPASPFSGELVLGGASMPLRGGEWEFLEAAPWRFEGRFPGQWQCAFDGFFIGLDAMGPRLPSGRRSKRRIIKEISISWPHDPHGEPAG